jgi:hypothetical protein
VLAPIKPRTKALISSPIQRCAHIALIGGKLSPSQAHLATGGHLMAAERRPSNAVFWSLREVIPLTVSRFSTISRLSNHAR